MWESRSCGHEDDTSVEKLLCKSSPFSPQPCVNELSAEGKSQIWRRTSCKSQIYGNKTSWFKCAKTDATRLHYCFPCCHVGIFLPVLPSSPPLSINFFQPPHATLIISLSEAEFMLQKVTRKMGDRGNNKQQRSPAWLFSSVLNAASVGGWEMLLWPAHKPIYTSVTCSDVFFLITPCKSTKHIIPIFMVACGLGHVKLILGVLTLSFNKVAIIFCTLTFFFYSWSTTFILLY